MSNLAWNSTNATSCTASNGWSGAKNTSGNTNVSPTVNTTYTLMCSGAGGNVTKSATITVTPVTPPQTATLTLQKTVVNDNGGQKSAADFQAKIDGGNVAWNSGQTVSVGSHTASEITLAGYTAGSWGGDCAANGTITFAAGDNKTCTITNDDQAATLIVKKVVIRDNGGSAATSTFSFKVNDGNAIAFEADGQNDLIVNAGTYTITEPAADGYTTSYDNCTDVVLANGGIATCTITNNDVAPQAATLTLIKSVINDNGGTTTPSAWTLSASGPTPLSGVSGSGSVTNASVTPGSYDLTESGGPSGYTSSGIYSCQKNGGPDVVGNTVVLANGDSAVCTITNDDQAGTLVVKKVVVNDNNGTKVFTDFSFQVNGGNATSFEADGQNDLTVNAGTYSVTEPAVAGYTTTYGNCSNVFIPNGGTATCTITNNDIAPVPQTATLTVLKVVTNNDGGDAVVADFPLFVDGIAITSGQATTTSVGAHVISETNQAGYTATFSGDCDANGNVSLAANDTKTCTITNDDNPPTQSVDHLLISEVYYDVSVAGHGAETANEWFELYNPTVSSVDLTNWWVKDGTTLDKLPNGTTIPAHSFLVVTAASTTSAFWSNTPMVSLENQIGNGLANTSDALLLLNANGATTTVDAISWGTNISGFNPGMTAVGDGHSAARSSLTVDNNSAADWFNNASPNPGL